MSASGEAWRDVLTYGFVECHALHGATLRFAGEASVEAADSEKEHPRERVTSVIARATV